MKAAVRAAVAAVVGAGVVLRFVATSPLWLDEALSVNIARLPVVDIVNALRHDGHPPLYYWLLHGWIELFGDSDVAVRSLSGIFGLATLPLAWIAGRRLAGPAAAWAAVAVLALNPFALRYATEARMYSFVMVLALVIGLLATDAVRSPSPWRLASVAVTVGMLLLTHYWGLWYAAALVVLLLGAGWRAGAGGERGRRFAVAGAVAAGGLALVPWLGVMRFQAEHTGTPWSRPVRPSRVLAETLVDFSGTRDLVEAPLLAALLVLLCALALFARPAGRGPRLELDVRTVPPARAAALLVVVTLGLGAAGQYVSGTTFASRYAAVVFPLFIVVAGLGLVRLPRGVPQALVGVALVGLSVAGVAYGLRNDRTQAGDIAAAINDRAGADDVVVYCPDQLGPAVDRLLPATLDAAVFPTGGSAERVDWVDYDERNPAADVVGFADDVVHGARGSVWLVTSGGYRTFEGKCEALHAAFTERLGGAELVVAEDAEFFEHAGLFRFPAPASS